MPQTIEQALEHVHAPAQAPDALPPLVEPEIDDTESNSRRPWIWLAATILLLAAAITTWQTTRTPSGSQYMTATVQRGNLARTITATGKTQAVTTVQVGTQVSGTVSEIYVDFNTPVKKGQVIARLDPAQLEAQLTQARANLMSARMSVQSGRSALASAQAAVEAADANVQRLQSMVDDAQLNFDRTQQLASEGIAARRDLDTAKAALNQAIAQKQQGVAQLNQAKAQAESARSQVAQGQAQVAQAQAQLDLANVNLDKSIIRAPIDGVIVARSVDPGQTVAASFNTPTLFLIANDLTRMQVLADIDEADVGQLTTNSKVQFTVDAFPNETFEGRISQIRLAPQTIQNVVTYTAVIDVPNPDGKLLPGMTANVTATVAERSNVLTVPNAALRFRPNEGQAQTQLTPQHRASVGTVWRLEDDHLEPVKVRLGITNGISTEVVRGDLNEGDVLVVADQTQQRKSGPAAGSPFGTPRGGRR